MHAYYKLGWSQHSSCALALATRQSWQRPHLQGMSVAKARQTRRSLLGCKYWNMVLWSGSGRGCFGYPAFARRSIEGRIEGPAQRFSLAVRHRFFWRCQKKWGRERSFPKAQPLDAPSQSAYRRATLPRREEPMQGLRPCPLDKPHAFAYTVRVKRLGREGVRASPDTERRRLVQGVSVRARKVVPEPHP